MSLTDATLETNLSLTYDIVIMGCRGIASVNSSKEKERVYNSFTFLLIAII